MAKYIDADKLKAEIERLKGQLIRGACAAQIEMETNCKDEAYNEVLAFLDTLSEESDKSLEEAATHYSEHARFHWPNQVKPSYDAFIAGAERQKEQMMDEAVEGIVHPYDSKIWVNLIGYGYKFNDGDKVRIIVLPKED